MFGILLCFFFIFITFRVTYLLRFRSKKSLEKSTCKTLTVIGSGGHTLEMIKHIKGLNPNWYSPRLYVIASTDQSSDHKVKEVEKEFQNVSETSYEIVKIPRSRAVNQSYFTSIFTTLNSILKSVPVVFNFKPDLILCNGPGTCIPICFIGFLLNALLFFNIKIVFVESICRVKTLSLSGKILLLFADVVIVQWEKLYKKYPKSVFLGRFI